MIHYPTQLDKIFSKLQQHSIKPIIVGGFIRDTFLGLTSKDIDIELYNTDSLESIEKILIEFGKVNSVGKSFGVLKLTIDDLNLDFSLPREDSKITKGHKGFVIKTKTSLTFKEAASRRDFTINAMGYDVIAKKILDPYNGKKDLQNKILRAVDLGKFAEDPLRVLRAVSFSARFYLNIDDKLFQLCKDMFEKGLVTELPRERIFEEMKKLLLKSKKPSHGLYLLKKISGFMFFNEFYTLNTQEYKDILDAIDRAVHITQNKSDKEKITIFLALLCHKFSIEKKYSFLEKLTNQKKLIENVIKFSTIDFDIEKQTNYTLYHLATQINISLYVLYLLSLYPTKKQEIKKLITKAKELEIFYKKLDPLVKGKDLITLGLQPSKTFSKILKDLYEKQMQEEFKNKNEALKYLKESLPIFT